MSLICKINNEENMASLKFMDMGWHDNSMDTESLTSFVLLVTHKKDIVEQI